MKHIIVEENIYSVSDRNSLIIDAAYNLIKAHDGDMGPLIEMVKKYGKYLGPIDIAIRQ